MSGWNSTLMRKAPMRRGGFLRSGCPKERSGKPRAALPKLGRSGKLWQAVWRGLKPRFEHAGITSCEVRGENCTGRMFLTPAHSLKRRNCVTVELLSEVVLACQSCHAAIEILKEAHMATVVRGIIDARLHPV